MKKIYSPQLFFVLLLFMIGCCIENYSPGDSADVHDDSRVRMISHFEMSGAGNALQEHKDLSQLPLKDLFSEQGKVETIFSDVNTTITTESREGNAGIHYAFPIPAISGYEASEADKLAGKADNKNMRFTRFLFYEPAVERANKNHLASENINPYFPDINMPDGIAHLAGSPDCPPPELYPDCCKVHPGHTSFGQGNCSTIHRCANDANGNLNCWVEKICTVVLTDNGSSPGGGGCGNVVITLRTKTPCEKTKVLVQKPEVREKIDELYGKSKTRGEKAFMIKNDGTPSDIIDSDEHSVILTNIEDNKGVWHNHTPEGIKMVSVMDIYRLFDFIVRQPSGTSPTEAFIGMVGTQPCEEGCPDGFEYFNYVVRFTGTAQQAKSISTTKYDFDALRDDYKKFELARRNEPGYSSEYGNYISTKGLEEVFFYALGKMGIDESKMVLQRIDKNGNVTDVTLGEDGKPTDTACP